MADKSEHLLDYLKKPSGYMAIVILVVTIIATFWVSFHFQDKKELTVQESQYNFLTRNKIDETDVNQHIQVYYDGKEIYDPHVVKITITNTGNQEITEDDFRSEKFEIFFNKNVILYDASVSNATPGNVQEEIILNIETQNNCLLINPFLLNPDESFTLSLITNQETDIFYNFRIAGISNTKKGVSIYISKLFILLFGIIVLLCIFFIMKMFKLRKRNSHTVSEIIPFVISLIASIVSTIVASMATASEIGKNMQQFIFK